MFLKIGILFVTLSASHLSVSLADTTDCNASANILLCLENKALEVHVSPNDLSCQASEVPKPKVRDDYTYTPGVGYHKFHTEAKQWNQARHTCIGEGGHLVIINSKQEEEVLRNMFKKQLNNIQGAKTIDEAFIGAHDLFEEGDWVTVLDEPLSSTGYVNWGTECYGPQPSSGENQRCAALTHRCPGLDNTWCTMPLAFFCELPDACS